RGGVGLDRTLPGAVGGTAGPARCAAARADRGRAGRARPDLAAGVTTGAFTWTGDHGHRAGRSLVMPSQSTEHATVRIDRTLSAAPAAVFRAFSDRATKGRWFVSPDQSASTDHSLDFRVGGRERLTTALPDGPAYTFDAEYRDIVPEVRIVYAYDMTQDRDRLSVSGRTREPE